MNYNENEKHEIANKRIRKTLKSNKKQQKKQNHVYHVLNGSTSVKKV